MNQPSKGLLPAAAAMMFFLGFEISGFQLVLLDISKEFNLDTQGMGMLAAAQYAAGVLAPLLFGRISDAIGKKKVTLIFASVFVAGCVFIGFSGGAWAFLLGAFFVGAGFSVCECTLCAAMLDAWGEAGERRLNFTQALFGMGAVVSPLIVNQLTVTLGLPWRVHFFLAGAGFLAAIPFLARVEFFHILGNAVERRGRAKSRLFTLPFLCVFICILIYTGLENGVGYFLDLLFATQLETPWLSAPALSVFWLCMAASRFLFSRLKIRARYAVFGLFFVSAVLLPLFLVGQSATLAFVISAAAGLAFGPIWAMLISMAGEENPERSGAAVSVMGAGSGFGGMASPMLFGAIAGWVGLKYSYWMLSGAAVLAIALMLLYIKKRPRNPAGE